MRLKYTQQLAANKRVEIYEAVQLIVDLYVKGEANVSINMPPRYGKSAIIRLASLELHELTKLPIIMTAPWSDNVDQIKSKEKIEETFKKYGVPIATPFDTHRVTALKDSYWWKQSTGVPRFQTCTMGLINNAANQQQFIDGLNNLRQRFKQRPIVMIDECHLIKELKIWGQFVAKLVQEADAFIVLLTGTPVPGIPGFECNYGDWKDFKRKIPRRKVENGLVKFVIETHEGLQRGVTDISADIDVSWKHAWDIDALAHVNVAWINTEVIDHRTNESLGKLADLDHDQLNGRIKDIMESSEMMRGLAKAGIQRLLEKRMHAPAAQAIVFTGADEFDPIAEISDRSVDKHAKQLKTLLERESVNRGASLRIAIATGNVEKASELVKAFRRGEIDILIVKMMGAVGLDVEACKVLIWGSRMRNGPLAIQALSRVLTTWNEEHADMVLPSDCRMMSLYKSVVGDNGGQYRETQSHLTGEEEYEPVTRPEWRFDNARIDAYSDEAGNTLNGEFEDILHIIKHKYQTQGMSDIRIIENFRRGGFPVSVEDEKQRQQQKTDAEASGVVDLDEGLPRVKGSFGREADALTSRHVDYKSTPEIWLKKNRELKSVAKEMCGVGNNIRVTDIDDAALLQRLVAALNAASMRVFGRA